jgi:hypothetical protein
MSLTWKLVPLAIVFALGAFALSPGAGVIVPQGASADVSSVTADDDSVNSGGSTDIDIDAQDDNGDLDIDMSSVESDTTVLMVIEDDDSCGGGDEEGDSDNDSLSIETGDCDGDTTVDNINIRIRLELSCPDDDVVRITATQNSVSDFVEVECIGGATVTPTGATSTPVATSTPSTGPASQISVSAAPTSVGCNGSSFVTVLVRSQSGANVPNGTVVTVSANIGSVSPGTATTNNGGILVVYTAPASQGGTATITATSGSVSGTTQIQLSCTTAPTAVPTQPVPTAVATIAPPRTGDAGLADDTPWTTYAGIILIAGSVLGAYAVVRKRA